MNALDLLGICQQHQVLLELVDSQHISVEPVDRLPAGVLEQLAQHKQDIIACLSQQAGQWQQGSQFTVGNDNIAPDYLPATHRRALNGFYWLLAQQQERLNKRGYPVHDALVKPGAWREQVQRVLGVHDRQAMQIEHDLIQAGLLAYDSHLRNYLNIGAGHTNTANPLQSESGNGYLLAGNTGQDFLNWLYSHYEP